MSKITLQHDGIIDIAFGRSRHDKTWKNKQTQWSDIVNKIKETHRTAENYATYISAKKDRQDEIKDIGGFVGGFLTKGRRLKNSVLHRQLVTLDIDHADNSIWETFTSLYDCSAALYSTHKHSTETPRFRLLIPLNREVFADEYQAIARKIAGNLNIELFDTTTFQPERLMYWPSTSKDGEYVFEFNDNTWLSADDILNSYRDWTDVSSWPVSDKVNVHIQRGMAKQGDPTEKPGVVGAFCRTYGIAEVIEKYLPEEYEQCDNEDRYSYTQGSTSGGLVLYDDKFAYSHHSTDPAGGKLSNAFDLVRLHKYGAQDEEAKEGTPSNRLPSYNAMLALCASDPEVKKRIVAERIDNAKHAFADVTIEDETGPTDDNWQEELEVDRKGNVYGTIDNIVLILENDPYFKNRFAFDDFEKAEVAVKNLPWRKINWNSRRLNDRDEANVRHYVERIYKISNGTKTRDAIQIVCDRHSYHPITEYLSSLKWDKENRLEKLFIDYMGVEDTPYSRAVTRKSFIAAVARVFKPGIKYDCMAVLVGEQGMKKSTLLSKMGGKWFSDTFSFHQLSKNETKAYEQIQGVWILEVPELSGMGKADVESVKHFLASPVDRFRVAYGRRAESFPRQCIVFGTTNKFSFLKDSANRRYFPLLCDKMKVKNDVFKLTGLDIDQLWAEATHYYNSGEDLHLAKEMELHAREIQTMHVDEHPWVHIIQKYLDTDLPDGWSDMDLWNRRDFLNGVARDETLPAAVIRRTRVCIYEIWEEALNGKDKLDERNARTIRECMDRISNWALVEKPFRYSSYGLQRKGYIRTDDSLSTTSINDFLN